MRIGEVLTMAEYINRDDLLKAAWDKPTLSLSVYDIGNIKPVDVAPVQHAKWEVVVGSDGKEKMVCTGCRKQQELTGVFSYCPNCGSKMDGET